MDHVDVKAEEKLKQRSLYFLKICVNEGNNTNSDISVGETVEGGDHNSSETRDAISIQQQDRCISDPVETKNVG